MTRLRNRRAKLPRKTKLDPKANIAPSIYSADEWAEIDSAVTAVRGTPLLSAERNSLLQAALRYRRATNEREMRAYVAPHARAKSWAKVARLCSQLCKALETAGRNREGDNWKTTPIVIVPNTMGLSLAKKLIGEHVVAPDRQFGGVLNIENIIELLAHLERSTAQTAEPFFWGISLLVSHTGRRDPQIIFFQHILWLWTDIFGGKLRFSRNPQSGKLSGPLIRFFFSVTRPAMTDKAPSIESIPDIVRRQRAFSQWLDDYMARCNSDRAELATVRLLGGERDNGEM